MKKVYICPETEVIKSHLVDQLLGHSYDWAAKENNNEDFFDENEETLKSRNLWDE